MSSSEWREYRFEELVINHDKRRKPLSSKERETRKGKFPYYGAQGIIDSIDDYVFDGKYMLIAEDGENLKSKKQNIAQLANGKFWVNNHAHVVENNEISDLHFLYYLFNITDVAGYITGSAQPKLSQSNLNSIRLCVPPLPEQKAIAATLSCLDDKIELNNRMNKNLEEMAQAIFKSWFVDFEPFQDGEFEESELGMIPKGWRVGTLGEVIELFDSMRKPLSSRVREKMDKKYPYYGATSLMDYVEDYIFDGIYVLLGEDGTVVNSEGYPILQYIWGKFWVNNHAHILKGKAGYNEDSAFMLLKNTNVQSIVTGAVQLKINQANLKSVKIVIPDKSVIMRYNEIIGPLFAKKRAIEEEIKMMLEIRDTLLPKLMSGEIRVAIEEVQ